MSELKTHVLNYLKGELPSTIRGIANALDIHNEMAELRACVDGLHRHKKLDMAVGVDGLTRYSIPTSAQLASAVVEPVSPVPLGTPAQHSVDAASAGDAAPGISDTQATVLQLLTQLAKPVSRSDVVEASGNALTKWQVRRALQHLRDIGRVVCVGDRMNGRWSLAGATTPPDDSRAEQPSPATPEPTAIPPAASDSASSEKPPAADFVLDPAVVERLGGNTLKFPKSTFLKGAVNEERPADVAGARKSSVSPSAPVAGTPLPHRLLARIESVAVDIEDLTGEAIDAGLGAGALKALVAAGGALRRALLPFNVRN